MDNLFVIKIIDGESFEALAKRYNLTVDILKKFNPHINDTMEEGDRIIIPFEALAIHVVQPLENLKIIANRYNVTIEKIKQDNDITDIFIGQQLIIKN